MQLSLEVFQQVFACLQNVPRAECQDDITLLGDACQVFGQLFPIADVGYVPLAMLLYRRHKSLRRDPFDRLLTGGVNIGQDQHISGPPP